MVRVAYYLAQCFFFVFMATSTSHAGELLPLALSNNSCSFYVALENQRQCSKANEPSNYLLGYGHKYCSRYLALSQHWEGELKQWTLNTLVCLKRELYQNDAELDTCQELESFALNSHPYCYVSNGFCTLSTKDKLRVLRQLNCLDLVLQPSKSLVQALALMEDCTADIDFAMLMSLTCTLL